MSKKTSNHEIVTLAVYLLGGKSQFIDTEDVAIKANEIAPGRFTWRKYRRQINIENITAFLRDAKKLKNGEYLVGSNKQGWMLTEAGSTFAQARVVHVKGEDLSGERSTAKERHWVQNERRRMLASDAYRKSQRGLTHSVTTQEAAAFFRVDDYVTKQARERKINRIINSFLDDHELNHLIKDLARKLKEVNG